MLMSLFVQLWWMSGAQQRCRLWSQRRVRMHSGTSDWLKSTVHLYIFQVNKYEFHECMRWHGRKRDKCHAVWYSGTNAFMETAASNFGARKAIVVAWGRGSGTVTFSKCDYTFSLLLSWRWKKQIPIYQTARHHVSEASSTVSETKAPDTMLRQFCPINVLSIQCMSLTAIFSWSSNLLLSPPNLCKLFKSQCA